MYTDKGTRSRAMFLEASKVLMSARCVNCHPAGDTPTQTDLMHPHYPTVTRGPESRGVVGMECATCHQDANQELARVPGAPDWHLAPLVMAWAGKTATEICEQIKDPKRNGGRTLDKIVDHVTNDKLVGWGWNPGSNRTPAPGTQKSFGALMAEWVATGAECPERGTHP